VDTQDKMMTVYSTRNAQTDTEFTDKMWSNYIKTLDACRKNLHTLLAKT